MINTKIILELNLKKRELPVIISLLSSITISIVDTIVVDGYVNLGNKSLKGLGAYLYDYLNKKLPIVGVAKTKFGPSNNITREILRGNSKKPLYITSAGIELSKASSCILKMHGDYRIPYIPKLVDLKTRETEIKVTKANKL